MVDGLWLYEYSALRPLSWDFAALWEQAQLMTRREQIAVTLSLLNDAYKAIVIVTAIKLQARRDDDAAADPLPHAPHTCARPASQVALARREEELIAEATSGGSGSSSSGEAVKAGALSAQDAAVTRPA